MAAPSGLVVLQQLQDTPQPAVGLDVGIAPAGIVAALDGGHVVRLEHRQRLVHSLQVEGDVVQRRAMGVQELTPGGGLVIGLDQLQLHLRPEMEKGEARAALGGLPAEGGVCQLAGVGPARLWHRHAQQLGPARGQRLDVVGNDGDLCDDTIG